FSTRATYETIPYSANRISSSVFKPEISSSAIESRHTVFRCRGVFLPQQAGPLCERSATQKPPAIGASTVAYGHARARNAPAAPRKWPSDECPTGIVVQSAHPLRTRRRLEIHHYDNAFVRWVRSRSQRR